MNTQATNDKQERFTKRVLRAADLRQQPGMAVQTDLKAGPPKLALAQQFYPELYGNVTLGKK